MSSVVFLVCFVWVFFVLLIFCLCILVSLRFLFFFLRKGMELDGWRDEEDLEEIKEMEKHDQLCYMKKDF